MRLKLAALAAITAATLTLTCGAVPSLASSRVSGPAIAGAKLPTLNAQVFPGAFLSLPEYVGVSFGIFAKHKVNVNLVPIGAGNLATEALVAGRVDVINNSLVNTIRLSSQGQDFKLVATTMRYPTTTWVAGPSWNGPAQGASLAEIVRSMKGARIAISARGAEVEFDTSVLLSKYGVDPSSVTYVPTGFGAPMVAALQKRQADIGVSIDPATTLLADTPGMKVLFDFRTGAPAATIPVGGIVDGLRFTTPRVIQTKRTALTRYLAAMREVLGVLRNPANVKRIATMWNRDSGINVALATKVLKHDASTWSPPTGYSCSRQLFMLESFFAILKDPIVTSIPNVSCNKLFWSHGLFYSKKKA